jgi:Zn-dependent protease
VFLQPAIMIVMDIVTYILIVVGTILVSMTLHEAMHAFVGYWLGDDTAKQQGRLSLNPIRHIDPFLTLFLPLSLAVIGAISGASVPIFGGAKPVPFNPDRVRGGEWGAALIALSGPLTNFVLAFVGYGVWVVAGLPADGLLAQILITFISVNLGFFVFNMLPIPPLDGSRVIYALAPEFVRSIMRFIEQFGLIFIFAIVLLASGPLGTLMQTIIDAIIALFNVIFRI